MLFNKSKKGALTIEAVISFSIFVSFMFLLLTMVKISMIKITINTAVSETAKQIAAAAYPIGILNSAAEENEKDIKTDFAADTVVHDLVEKNTGFGMDMIFANGDEKKETKAEAKSLTDLFGYVGGLGLNAIETVLFPKVQNAIESHSYEIAANGISEIIDNSHVGIDKKELKLLIVKMPSTQKNYNENYNDSESLNKLGLNKSDFDKDDVVIGVEYAYKIALPFITTIDIKMRDVAVEHGWVNGGSGNINKLKEGIKIDSFMNFDVYVTPTGKKYHREDCPSLWSGNTSKMSKSDAKVAGYSPCVRCTP